MEIGMLWLDADRSRSFEDKVTRAVDYYKEKYGRFPELCFVNDLMVEDEKKVGRVRVVRQKTIMPDHFWLGMNNS